MHAWRVKMTECGKEKTYAWDVHVYFTISNLTSYTDLCFPRPVPTFIFCYSALACSTYVIFLFQCQYEIDNFDAIMFH